jgi:hypothetical protein
LGAHIEGKGNIGKNIEQIFGRAARPGADRIAAAKCPRLAPALTMKPAK